MICVFLLKLLDSFVRYRLEKVEEMIVSEIIFVVEEIFFLVFLSEGNVRVVLCWLWISLFIILKVSVFIYVHLIFN